MPQMIKTIDELIATDLKRDGYWFVFNMLYNDIKAFHKSPPADGRFWLDEKFTDNEARQEFIDFMAEHFPTIKTYEVMDLVSIGTLMWPYLGSIAVDIQKGDPAYQALSAKYGYPEEDATDNRHVFWTIRYEMAVEVHTKRETFWDEELEEDD